MTPESTPTTFHLNWRTVPVLLPLLFGGCAAYEAPKPGLHKGPHEAQAGVTCVFEAPAGTRFMTERCIVTKEKERESQMAREFVESTKPAAVRSDGLWGPN